MREETQDAYLPSCDISGSVGWGLRLTVRVCEVAGGALRAPAYQERVLPVRLGHVAVVAGRIRRAPSGLTAGHQLGPGLQPRRRSRRRNVGSHRQTRECAWIAMNSSPRPFKLPTQTSADSSTVGAYLAVMIHPSMNRDGKVGTEALYFS